MKVQVIKAYKSEDDCLFEEENDAINQNIDLCIERMEHRCEGSSSGIYTDIKKWFRDHPGDVRYILANIKKVKDLIPD
jgi:hypothetical protein